MSFDAEQIAPPGARIKVIGVGGGGGNAVNTMIKSGLEGVDFVTCNTDVQALKFSLATNKIQIGRELTRGLGAGADPDVGRDAALEDRTAIQEYLSGADMVFITAGTGGGTGTGGASVVAQIARELGALTVAVVTKPFTFEGKRRKKHADIGVARLREAVDTLITIPNQRLLQVATPGLSMMEAFKMADEVLVNAVRGISDIINIPGTVNVDFADVKTVMSCMGQALMGIGRARGEGRAIAAARQAISSPLLEDVDIEGATGILINITAGSDVTLMEVNEACSIIQEAAHEDANIIFGAVIDETLGEEIRVTVIATGFPVEQSEEDAIEMLKQQQQTTLAGFSGSRTGGYRRPEPQASRPVEAPRQAAPAPTPAPVVKAQPETQTPAPQPQAQQQYQAQPSPLQPQRREPDIEIPSLSPSLEAQELARWTFDLADAPSASPTVSHDSDEPLLMPMADDSAQYETREDDARHLEGARLLDDPNDDFVRETAPSFVERVFSDEYVEHESHHEAILAHPSHLEQAHSIQQAPATESSGLGLPMEGFFRRDFSPDEIDR